MEFKEILDYGLKAVTYSSLAYALAVGTSFMLAEILYGDKIESHKKLKEIIEEESKKLNIDTKGIEFVLDSEIGSGSGKLNKDGKKSFMTDADYLVAFDSEPTKAKVRHELYHVYRGHCDAPKGGLGSLLKNLLIREPQAIIYSSTGLRL